LAPLSLSERRYANGENLRSAGRIGTLLGGEVASCSHSWWQYQRRARHLASATSTRSRVISSARFLETSIEIAGDALELTWRSRDQDSEPAVGTGSWGLSRRPTPHPRTSRFSQPNANAGSWREGFSEPRRRNRWSERAPFLLRATMRQWPASALGWADRDVLGSSVGLLLTIQLPLPTAGAQVYPRDLHAISRKLE
jgi:hypothetical protein